MGSLRLRHAVGLVCVVAAIQAGAVGARAARDPAPFRTFHDFDVTLARTVRVMRGEAWAESLPVGHLVPPTQWGQGPAQLWAAVPGNSAEAQKMYKKEQPLFFLLSGLVPAALGLGPVSLRLGPLSVLWALTGLLGWAAHRLAGPRGLLAVGVLALLVPAGWQAAMMSLPGLGMMLGAALVLASVLASDRLRQPLGALAVGGCVAVAAWMGESAGDSVQVLAATLPTVVAGGIWGAVGRGTLPQRARAVAGMGAALGVAWVLVDRPWILRHTQGYLLSEASGGARPPGVWQFLSTVPSGLAGSLVGERFVGGYLETLGQSLLTPAGAGVVALGAVAGLAGRRRGALLWALSGPVALLVLLSLPEKTGDYYALAAVPGILLAAAVGIAGLGRLGLGGLAVGGAGLAVVCATVVHMDLQPVQRAICTDRGGVVLLQDPLACASVDPHPRIRPTLRIARELPASPETRRMAVAQWLHGLDMAPLWDSLPAQSTIWVLGGPQSPSDTAEVVALTSRSDLMVRTLPTDIQAWRARPTPGSGEQWVFLMGEVRAGTTLPPRWPAWLGKVEDYAGTGDIRVGRWLGP